MANAPKQHVCGRKPEHPEETHVTICKLHTDSDPSWELNLDLWCCEAAVLATVLPRPGKDSRFPSLKDISEQMGFSDNRQWFHGHQ